jgi:multisubunit Na+/H+ antiporter MnhF subunit
VAPLGGAPIDAFLMAAVALLAGFVPLGWVCVRRKEIDGVVALQVAGVLTTLILLCLAEGFHRSVYAGVAVVSAALTWVSGFVFARFFGRL